MAVATAARRINEYWGREGLGQAILDGLAAAGKDTAALTIDDSVPKNLDVHLVLEDAIRRFVEIHNEKSEAVRMDQKRRRDSRQHPTLLRAN